MTFTEACVKARKQGGGYVFGYGNAKYEVTEEGNVINRSKDKHHNPSGSGWKVSPKNPPVLMTMAQAIAKAVEMGGGEVWLNRNKAFTVTHDLGVICHRHLNAGNKLDMISYTVCPLPSADMSFDEALECLKRKEEVIVVDDDDNAVNSELESVLQPLIATKRHADRMYGWWCRSIDELKDKRFRKAQQ